MTIQKILFPTDFTATSERAFSAAARLADVFDAELHVLNAAVEAYELSDDPMGHLNLRRESGDTWSDAVTPGLFNGSRVVHAQVRGSSPSDGILEYADQHAVDLIVMATHGRRGLDRFLLGSVAEEIVRRANCPVLTLRDPAKAAGDWKRILVPLDFDESASATLAYAMGLAASSGAELDLLHVIEEAVFPTIYGVDSFAVAVPSLVEDSRHALTDLAERTDGPTAPYTCHVRIGHPATEIAGFAAENDADLIVMATHGYTGIQHLILGSVAAKVVRTAPCPAITMKVHETSTARSAAPPQM